jgi:hypothetical protein
MTYCFHWKFVPPENENLDPAYHLFMQTASGKLASTKWVIQDTSAYSKDPQPFIIYAPAKSAMIGQMDVKPVEMAANIFEATVVAISMATGRGKA